MGMIQQSINQTLSLAGFLYSQTEDAKKAQKISGLESKLSQYDKREKLLREAYSKSGKTKEDMGSMLTNKIQLQGERAEILEELYKNDPSMERHDVKEKLKGSIAGNKTALEGLAKIKEQGDQAYQSAQEYMETMNAEEEANQVPASNVEVENWETPSDSMRAIADQKLAEAQKEKIETINRKKGFTSQRYGTNKTKVFGGKI